MQAILFWFFPLYSKGLYYHVWSNSIPYACFYSTIYESFSLELSKNIIQLLQSIKNNQLSPEYVPEDTEIRPEFPSPLSYEILRIQLPTLSHKWIKPLNLSEKKVDVRFFRSLEVMLMVDILL